MLHASTLPLHWPLVVLIARAHGPGVLKVSHKTDIFCAADWLTTTAPERTTTQKAAPRKAYDASRIHCQAAKATRRAQWLPQRLVRERRAVSALSDG